MTGAARRAVMGAAVVLMSLPREADCLDAYPSLSSLNPLSSFFGTSHSRRLPVPRVKWADDRKVFQRIGSDKGKPVEPFIVEGSPITKWPAIKSKRRRWTLRYLESRYKSTTAYRTSDDPEFLSFNIDKWTAELGGQNQKYWAEYDAWKQGRKKNEVSSQVRDPSTQKKFFRWEPPHEFTEVSDQSRPLDFEDLIEAEKDIQAGTADQYIYQSQDIGSNEDLYKLTADLEPCVIMSHPLSQRDANGHVGLGLWSGNTNVTATLHYDVGHNIHVQITGKKHWLLFPPEALDGNKTTMHPQWHPSERQAQLPVDIEGIVHGLPQGKHAYEVTMAPGDALVIPAYWMHTVRAIEGPVFSVNTWRPHDDGNRLDQFSRGTGKPRMLNVRATSIAGLRRIIGSVVASVMLGRKNSPLAACRDGAFDGDSARACVHEFIQSKVQQRWAPLLNLNSDDVRFDKCRPIQWRAPHKRGLLAQTKGPYFVPWPKVHRVQRLGEVVEPLRRLQPEGAIGTLLMDWVEVVCYYHIRPFTHENGAGFRECPFMLNDCF